MGRGKWYVGLFGHHLQSHGLVQRARLKQKPATRTYMNRIIIFGRRCWTLNHSTALVFRRSSLFFFLALLLSDLPQWKVQDMNQLVFRFWRICVIGHTDTDTDPIYAARDMLCYDSSGRMDKPNQLFLGITICDYRNGGRRTQRGRRCVSLTRPVNFITTANSFNQVVSPIAAAVFFTLHEI